MSLKLQWKLTIGRYRRGTCIWWIHQGNWWQLHYGEVRYVLFYLFLSKGSFVQGEEMSVLLSSKMGIALRQSPGCLRIRGREKVEDCLVSFRCDVLNLSLTNCWHDLTNVFWTTADIMSWPQRLKITGFWLRKGYELQFDYGKARWLWLSHLRWILFVGWDACYPA